MGAINYRTSNYITLGYNLRNIEENIEEISEEINFCYEEIQNELQKYDFNYFYVKCLKMMFSGAIMGLSSGFRR